MTQDLNWLCLVPTCKEGDSLSASKLSKATILSKTIDYIEYITNEADEDHQSLEKLQKEATGKNYIVQIVNKKIVAFYTQFTFWVLFLRSFLVCFLHPTAKG